MTAFVILAAGRGTRIGRVGEMMHKALIPLEGEAILSHLFRLAPDDARIAVCVGHRAEQIKSYVSMAHPDLDVTFIHVSGWDKTGGGPGLSLMAAQSFVGDEDMVFTSCDTLWDPSDRWLFDLDHSWAGVAAVPAGTPPARWCRIINDRETGRITIADKTPEPLGGTAYIGVSQIVASDLPTFWNGIAHASLLFGETQVTGGLQALVRDHRLSSEHMRWTDVGDEDAYARAVALRSGYDWTKSGEATYVLPPRRVIKFFADETTAIAREQGRRRIANTTPAILDHTDHMLAYEFIDGVSVYSALEAAPDHSGAIVESLMSWAVREVWRPVEVAPRTAADAATDFYHHKTYKRIDMLHPTLQSQARDAVSRIDWAKLAAGTAPCTYHGDFNFGNIILESSGRYVGIDWRGDFAGITDWGDMRYDLGKLVSGTVVHWDNARRGDFRPWDLGEKVRKEILSRVDVSLRFDANVIGALTLINSAPLHASPLDEILIARGVAWLEEVLG